MALGISCDSRIPDWAGGSQVTDGLSKLSEIVSDVCFYSCFVTILWDLSINKYTTFSKGLASTVASFFSLGRYVLEKGIEIGDAGTGILEALIESLQSIGEGALDLVKSQYTSFPDALWSLIKGEVIRYFDLILLASIQAMVKDLETELGNRRKLLGEVELKIDEVKTSINNLFGYDWWEDWLASATIAAARVRDADRELQRSYSDLNQGNWDSLHLDKCQDHLLSAWKLLSSDDAFNEFMTFWSDQMDPDYSVSEYTPFDSSFYRNQFNEFMDDLKDVGEKMSELKEMYTCLNRISGRANLLQALIIAAANVVKGIVDGTGPKTGFFIDSMLEQGVLKNIHDKLIQIYTEMTDVIENERKTVAPIKNMQWRNEIKGILLLFSGFGGLPSPFGLDFRATTSQANNQLEYLIAPHSPSDGVRSLSEYDFSAGPVARRLQEFIVTAGNLSDLLTRHSQWEQKITQIKTSIRNMKRRDASAKALCETFSGYENDRYNYVADLLESIGWTAAHKYLTTGKIHELVQLSVSSLSMNSVAMECLSGMISSMVEDSGLQFKLNTLLAEGMADDRVATRTSVALPSLQFKVFNTIQNQLLDLQSKMQDILDIEGEVCS